MIISIEMNDKMLSEFFSNAGYKTETLPVQEWRSQGHNQLKEFHRDVLHVITTKGEKKPAVDVFQEVMRLRATHPDQVTINQVKRVLNDD